MNSSTGETPAHNYSRVDELLQAREARVLAWSLVARLIAFSIVTVFSLLQLLGVVRGIVADTDADAVIVLFLSMACGAAVVYGLVLARRGEQLRRVGLGAVFLDLAFMASLPFIWLQTTPTYASLGFLMKGELFTLASTMLVVNTLTLTPLYPALIAAGSILIHVAIIVIVTLDPRVVFVSGYMEHFSTPAVNPGVFNLRILILALEGAFLWLLAKTARRTIRDAVELEVSNFEIKERQAELLMEGKMAAMSELVAGVAHEVNTPLGVVRSNLDTSEAATSKLAEAVPSGNAAIERIVQVMKENGRVARQAVARIAKVVGSLKDFASLDQAELQRTDIREGLDTALALIEPNKKAGI